MQRALLGRRHPHPRAPGDPHGEGGGVVAGRLDLLDAGGDEGRDTVGDAEKLVTAVDVGPVVAQGDEVLVGDEEGVASEGHLEEGGEVRADTLVARARDDDDGDGAVNRGGAGGGEEGLAGVVVLGDLDEQAVVRRDLRGPLVRGEDLGERQVDDAVGGALGEGGRDLHGQELGLAAHEDGGGSLHEALETLGEGGDEVLAGVHAPIATGSLLCKGIV